MIFLKEKTLELIEPYIKSPLHYFATILTPSFKNLLFLDEAEREYYYKDFDLYLSNLRTIPHNEDNYLKIRIDIQDIIVILKIIMPFKILS